MPKQQTKTIQAAQAIETILPDVTPNKLSKFASIMPRSAAIGTEGTSKPDKDYVKDFSNAVIAGVDAFEETPYAKKLDATATRAGTYEAIRDNNADTDRLRSENIPIEDWNNTRTKWVAQRVAEKGKQHGMTWFSAYNAITTRLAGFELNKQDHLLQDKIMNENGALLLSEQNNSELVDVPFTLPNGKVVENNTTNAHLNLMSMGFSSAQASAFMSSYFTRELEGSWAYVQSNQPSYQFELGRTQNRVDAEASVEDDPSSIFTGRRKYTVLSSLTDLLDADGKVITTKNERIEQFKKLSSVQKSRMEAAYRMFTQDGIANPTNQLLAQLNRIANIPVNNGLKLKDLNTQGSNILAGKISTISIGLRTYTTSNSLLESSIAGGQVLPIEQVKHEYGADVAEKYTSQVKSFTYAALNQLIGGVPLSPSTISFMNTAPPEAVEAATKDIVTSRINKVLTASENVVKGDPDTENAFRQELGITQNLVESTSTIPTIRRYLQESFSDDTKLGVALRYYKAGVNVATIKSASDAHASISDKQMNEYKLDLSTIEEQLVKTGGDRYNDLDGLAKIAMKKNIKKMIVAAQGNASLTDIVATFFEEPVGEFSITLGDKTVSMSRSSTNLYPKLEALTSKDPHYSNDFNGEIVKHIVQNNLEQFKRIGLTVVSKTKWFDAGQITGVRRGTTEGGDPHYIIAIGGKELTIKVTQSQMDNLIERSHVSLKKVIEASVGRNIQHPVIDKRLSTGSKESQGTPIKQILKGAVTDLVGGTHSKDDQILDRLNDLLFTDWLDKPVTKWTDYGRN